MTKQNTLLTVLLVLLVTISNIVAADSSSEINIPKEDDVFSELNAVRTSPKTFARYLEKQRQLYNGNKFKRPGEITIVTKEGVAAVNEAIAFLNSVTPVTRLTLSMGLSKAAADHVKDQSRTGKTGHSGSDRSSPGDRIDRYGAWTGVIGENIQYGDETARDVVISLIIDDGVPGRGHRGNIFESDFHMVGIACGAHPKWRTICVMDFSESYHE